MGRQTINDHRITIRFACQAFKISETCYRYDPKPSSENGLIADWLLRLTTTHKQWASGCALCIYVTPKALNGIISVCIVSTSNKSLILGLSPEEESNATSRRL